MMFTSVHPANLQTIILCMEIGNRVFKWLLIKAHWLLDILVVNLRIHLPIFSPDMIMLG